MQSSPTMLYDILIVFGLAIGVLYVCHRLHVHMVVGLLLTGVLAGPHGLHLIGEPGRVEQLAELGVMLLVFTIGIEFSLSKLLRIARFVFVGGGLQVGLTVAFCVAALGALTLPLNQALMAGFMVSMSSTSVIMKLLQERSEVTSRHGQVSLAVSIFQDVASVPMMLVIPLLVSGTHAELPWRQLLAIALKGVLIVVLALIAARYVVPRLLFIVARTRSREIFVMTILGLGVAVALLTSWAGLSLALGAFLAGLIISESEYGHQALGNLGTLKDVLSSLFFISIGMLLSSEFFFLNVGLILTLTLAMMGAKLVLMTGIALGLGVPLRTAILVGTAISNIGEFSFILAQEASRAGVLDDRLHQLTLAVTVVSIGLTPLILRFAPNHLASWCLRLPLPDRIKYGTGADLGRLEKPLDGEEQRDHLVIVGFGITGQHLARAIAAGGIPYVVVETNPDTVATEKKRGEPIFFGDAVEEAVLTHAGIDRALVLAITIPDPIATRQIVAVARQVNPGLHIVARTRYVREVEILQSLGANDVIAEEFETSLQLFAQVLERYLLPQDLVEQFTEQLRTQGPQGGKPPVPEAPPVAGRMPDFRLGTFRAMEGSRAVGARLGDLPLKRYQAVAVAVVRGKQVSIPAAPDWELQAGDQLLVAAVADDLGACEVLFHAPRQGASASPPPG